VLQLPPTPAPVAPVIPSPPPPANQDPQTVAAAAAFDAFKNTVKDLCAQHGGDQTPIKAVTPRYGAQQLSAVHPSLYDSFVAEMRYAFSNMPGYQAWLEQAKKPDGTLVPATEYPWPMG
jgi:hypothetical protein